MSRKTRLAREYRKARAAMKLSRNYKWGPTIATNVRAPQEAWKSALGHDAWVRYRWTIDRHLRGKIRDGMQFTIDGVLFKTSMRGYGVKYVTWEPLTIHNHFSHLPAGHVVVVDPGEGEILE